MGNRGPVGKIDRGLRMGQNRWENAGSKSKVQVGQWGDRWVKEKTRLCWKNILMEDMFEQLNKPFNDESSISQEEAEAGPVVSPNMKWYNC